MPVTVTSIQASLVGRGLGSYYTALGLDAAEALADPILEAMISLGIPLATPGVVTDEDVADLTDFDLLKLLDRAELSALFSIYGNGLWFDQTKGDTTQKFSQLRDALMFRINFLIRRTDEPYEPPVVPVPGTGAPAHGRLTAGRCPSADTRAHRGGHCPAYWGGNY